VADPWLMTLMARRSWISGEPQGSRCARAAGPGQTLAEVLEQTAGHGDANTDQDQAADQFAALAGLGAEPVAQFQADQGQANADHGDEDRGYGQVDVEGAQREADRQVVDTQRRPGN
jgi:hypothetical protein